VVYMLNLCSILRMLGNDIFRSMSMRAPYATMRFAYLNEDLCQLEKSPSARLPIFNPDKGESTLSKK
jgi:hypothetical protein